MWYITFHGGQDDGSDGQGGAGAGQASKSGVNKVHAYDDDGQLITKDVLPASIPNVTLDELRGIGFGAAGYLYVVNSYSGDSQILYFTGAADSHGTHDFLGVFVMREATGGLDCSAAARGCVESIVHPFAFTFDGSGNCYVSSQDTNVATLLPASGTPQIAPYLAQTYPNNQFLPGTFVASSNGALPKVPQAQPDVSPPQGLEVAFDKSNTKVVNSVRDVLFNQGSLYVADEPGNAVKIYDGTSGELTGEISDSSLLAAPVHLLLAGDDLYIGSTGTPAGGSPGVVRYSLTDGTYAPFITRVDSPSGMGIGADGNFYVALRKGRCVAKYSMNGVLLGCLVCDLPDDPEFLLYVPDATRSRGP